MPLDTSQQAFIIHPPPDFLQRHPALRHGSAALAQKYASKELVTDEMLQQVGQSLWQTLDVGPDLARARQQAGVRVLPLVVEGDDPARMHEAMTHMQGSLRAVFADVPAPTGAPQFLDAVERDVEVARGAIGVVLSREHIASLLIDNLNASVHVRAMLTDLFLIDQAMKVGPT